MEKNKNFLSSDTTTRKNYPERNNTNSKTALQRASNTGIRNEDANNQLKPRTKKKIVVTGDSILNGISNMDSASFAKEHGNSNTILENLALLLKTIQMI